MFLRLTFRHVYRSRPGQGDAPGHPYDQRPAVIDSADLVESWSGYALRRQGVQVVPYVIPEHEATNRVNFTSDTGTIRFWFRPNWGSPSEGGTGPGSYARLIELVGVTGTTPVVWWSVYANPQGTALYWSGQGPTGPVDFLSAELHWPAGTWHRITLSYSPTDSAVDAADVLLPFGTGLSIPPIPAAFDLGLVLGSDWAGTGTPKVSSTT